MSAAQATERGAKATKPARTRKDTKVTKIAPQGLYRWGQIEHMMGVSRETWRLRIKAGRAPRPRLEEENLTAWNGADLIAWLDDPRGYRAATGEGAGGDDV
jgi:predicted DNA-binding transcriptional regulator AlpA